MAGTRTFQDHNFLVWEVYPSGGRPGFAEHRHLIFNCLTQPGLRPRVLHFAADGGASPQLSQLMPAQLIELLEHARELP